MSEARDGSGSTRGATAKGRGSRARGVGDGTGEAPIDLAGARRKHAGARRGAPEAQDGAQAEGRVRSEVRATAALRREAFPDDEATVRTEHPRALLDETREHVHEQDTRVVHVSKILADADRALDALSHEISVVAPLPTAPAEARPPQPPAEARAPAEVRDASAPRVMTWPPVDAQLPRAQSTQLVDSQAHRAWPEPTPAQPARAEHHAAHGEARGAALVPSLPARPFRVRALLLPAAVAVVAAGVVARLVPSAPAARPGGTPLALQHVITVENRGPRSAEPPRPQTLLEAFQQGPVAQPPRDAEPLALVDAARRALADGRPGEAHALASRAVQRDAFGPHGFAVLAEAELALGAPEHALEAALAAAKLRPKRVRYQHLLARVYGALGRTEDAREAQRLAELLAPGDPDVRAMERAAQRAQQR